MLKKNSRLDEDRCKAVGGDQVCAEWVVRCGGKIKFEGHQVWTSDYDCLNANTGPFNRRVVEIDCTGACVNVVGFRHFSKTKIHIDSLHFRQSLL